MGYMHIDNLAKNDSVLMFRKVWATEKVHGTSAHVSWNPDRKEIVYFNGGASRDAFVALFDKAFEERFMELVDVNGRDISVTVFGEAYGGKMQGMSATYGKVLKFIVFEVKIGDSWLSFDKVVEIGERLQLDVVPGEVIDCTEEELTRVRNLPSEVAVMCGCGENEDRYGNKPPLREGIVIRPLVELRMSNGDRVIAKYKNPDFSETKSRKDCNYPSEKRREYEAAAKVVDDYVTDARLGHVLDAIGLQDPNIQDLGKVLPAMVEDVLRESKGEVPDTKEIRRMIGGKTVPLFKKRIGML